MNPLALPKFCRACGVQIHEPEWRALKLLGYLVGCDALDNAVLLEMRNHTCGSTLSIGALRPAIPHDSRKFSELVEAARIKNDLTTLRLCADLLGVTQ